MAVVRVMIIPECLTINPIRSIIFLVQFTVSFTALIIEGLSFSINSIPISFILFFACASLVAAVSDLVAACSMATLVSVTAWV